MKRMMTYLRARFFLTPLSKEQAEIMASIKHPCC